MRNLTEHTSDVGECDEALENALQDLIEKASHIYRNQHLVRLLTAAKRLNALGLDPANMLEKALSEWPSARAVAVALSQHEVRILGSGEALPLASDLAILESRTARETRFQQALNDGLSTSDVADLLQLSGSRVRQLVVQGKLFAIGLNRARRFPRFQFTSAGTLPHLDCLLSAITGWHPLTIIRFFTVPDADLSIEGGKPISAAEWLANGGDVAVICALLEGR